METRKKEQGVIPPVLLVLEVTMRDGNPEVQLWRVLLLYPPVLEVTMRDGNPFATRKLYASTNGFRSDYEGWKLLTFSFQHHEQTQIQF